PRRPRRVRMEAWWVRSISTVRRHGDSGANPEWCLTRAGLLMEGAAADAPPPWGVPGLPAGRRPAGWQERRPPAGVSSGSTGGAQLSADPLDGARGAKAMEPSEVDRLLASIQHRGGTKSLAKLIGRGQAALPVIRAGLRSTDWRIRRDCLRFLDHQTDPGSGRLVLECLEDEHPEARKSAAHALGCDPRKPEGRGDFDDGPYLLRLMRDYSRLR